MSQLQSLKALLAPKLHRIIEYMRWQGPTIAGNLLYGFLCVRLLPIADYAKFAVVFGVMGTFTVLMDVGTCSTLLPLIGEHVDDLGLIADYIASLRSVAHRLYLVVAPVIVIFYPFLVRKQHWSWLVVATMVAILLVGCWSSRVSGAYGAVLIVRGERKNWYKAQMVSSLGTLAMLLVFWAFHGLNAFSAILINLLGIAYVATTYFFRSRSLLGLTGRPSREKRKAILHLCLPIMPNMIFYALQGQIALFLITLFGRISSVAGLGALSRLGQIFALFAPMSAILVEPYFAKLPKCRLLRNYIGAVGVLGAFTMLIPAISARFPEIFLWILGHKYSNLRFEVFLALTASSISFFTGVMCAIHNVRRFVYWWNGIVTIISVLAVQAIFIWKVDLSTVRSVLMLNIVSGSVVLIINAATGAYGFLCGARELPSVTPAPQIETFLQS